MEQDKHIVKSYDEEIKDINSKILEMGTLVENQLKDSLNALKNQDTELAEKVILNDDLIDDAYNKLCLLYTSPSPRD